jgi:hypothetical protein
MVVSTERGIWKTALLYLQIRCVIKIDTSLIEMKWTLQEKSLFYNIVFSAGRGDLSECSLLTAIHMALLYTSLIIEDAVMILVNS